MNAATSLKAFSQKFGVPFLLGRTCEISSPLGQDGFAQVRHGLSIDVELEDACDEQYEQAALLTDISPAPFDEDAATLLYAVHELFCACHPQAASFYARAHTFCQAAEDQVLKLPRTYDPSRLLTRHLIVERAFATTRTDVHLKWWTGHASFYGKEPPKRLTAMPQLRRVHIDRRTIPMWRIALTDGDEETRVARTALMTALLNISPLTRLLMLGTPAQRELGFSLMLPLKSRGKRMSPIYLLDDTRLSRAVCDVLMERGVENVGPMLGLALLQAVRETSAPLVQRWAAELCTHLLLLMCLVESEAPGARQAQALRTLLDSPIDSMHDTLRVYWAAVLAVLSLDGRTFELPPPSDMPPAAASLFAKVKRRLHDPFLSAIAEPLARELSRRLPPVGGLNTRSETRKLASVP